MLLYHFIGDEGNLNELLFDVMATVRVSFVTFNM